MSGTMNILFYPKRTGSDIDGIVTLYARITVNGRRSEFSLRRTVDKEKWSSVGGKLRGTTREVSNLNRFLDCVKNRCYGIYDELLKEGEHISPDAIKNIYLGKRKKQWMLLEIFQEHNDEMESLVGKDYAAGTLQRYKAAKNHISDYLRHTYGKKDIPVDKIDHKFITGLEYFLKSKKRLGHNSTIKYIVNLKKIVRIAYANQWIARDPFFHWKARWKNNERKYLTEAELQRLIDKSFKMERLERVKDIFLFSCFTGLAYIDVKTLGQDDIVIDINGEKWIKTTRKKTKTRSSIPLLPVADAILDKYAAHPNVVMGKGLLPVLTNQKSNAYLKEIADLCGIKKNLTTHLARHTFATTVTLSNGVPIESVGRMLGHRSLKTTQIYAKVLDKKLAEDMSVLKNRFSIKDDKEKAVKFRNRVDTI